ncbi:MAG TPA: lamin tail domain-containing protein, partial [bacterium]|nr:lamin tail domain-containing protein [bacterium]
MPKLSINWLKFFMEDDAVPSKLMVVPLREQPIKSETACQIRAGHGEWFSGFSLPVWFTVWPLAFLGRGACFPGHGRIIDGFCPGMIYFDYPTFIMRPMIMGWRGFIVWFLVCRCAGLLSSVPWAAADDLDVVINEIHYHPDSDLETEEFVELYNRGGEPVDLGGWAFSRGIHFVFPPATVLPPDGYLVVARDADGMASWAPDATVLGNYEGMLANGGETVTLYNRQGKAIDSVPYQDNPPWPTSPDGRGPSLERISPFGPSSDPRNWMAATLDSGVSGKAMTPGSRNSVFSLILPPYVEQVLWDPPCPPPGREVTVTASISDETDVDRVYLIYQPVRWGAQNQPEQVLPMQLVAGTSRAGSWSVTVPGQLDRTLVRFRVTAENAAGVERVFPAPTEARHTMSYFHYLDDEIATIPIV